MITASDNFKTAWVFALRWEGGTLENVPGDKGGLTKYGVDQASHPHVNIRALTADQAAQIYHDNEWVRCRCDDLPCALAVAVFDFAMNSGAGTAISKLQSVLGVVVDGWIGEMTIAAAKRLWANDAAQTVEAYLDARTAFLRAAAHKGDNAKFLRGWLNRVEALYEYLSPSLIAASGGKPGKGAASGSVGLAAPLCLAVASLAPVLAEAALTPEVIAVAGGLIGIAIIAKLMTGLLVDAKKLRERPVVAPPLPSPLVVRPADQFVTQDQIAKIETDMRNQMVELRSYVHDAVHEIKGLANTFNLAMQEASENTHEFFTRLDAKNEERVQRIAARVDEVIDRTPEKIISLLRQTGALKS